jgi:hypothetical protein
MDEFAVLKQHLPLEANLSKYLLVKTTVHYASDLEFRLEVGLENTVRKFQHTDWNEMRPLVVGIKCYTKDVNLVYVRHGDRLQENTKIIDSFDVKNETWYTFKYPLLANYHTDTRILLGGGITAYTLAILNPSQCVREAAGTNYLPTGYKSFDTTPYGSDYNKALVYVDGNNYINPAGAELTKSILVVPTNSTL